MRFTLFLLMLMPLFCNAQSFPADFTGHWEGELQWFRAGSKGPQKVKMQLVIQPTDSLGVYSWQLVYGSGGTDNRSYSIRLADTARGHWVVDEKNGIFLDHYWLGGRLSTAFTVQQTTIVNTYYRAGKKLAVEFYSLSAQPARQSGGTSADVPPVASYALKGFQKALLKKKRR